MTTVVSARGHGLAPTRHVLPNGAVVLVKRTASTPAVTLHASFRAGSVFEPATMSGLAHFVSRVIDRGTTHRTADEIAEDLDNRGVSLKIRPNRHAMSIVCTCLAEDFDAMSSIVADVARNATFPDEEVEKRRAEMLTTLLQDQDNPGHRATEALFELLYGSAHPYGRPAKGRRDTVERIERRDLMEFYRSRFTPSSLSLVIVGDVESEAALDAAVKLFADWSPSPAPEAIVPPVPDRRDRSRVVLPMMNKSQVDIAYGFITITRLDPAYYSFWVMNTILGQYGLGGRLGDNIRERQGMAYYTYSSFDAHVIEGPLIVRAGVNPKNVTRTIATIDDEITRIATEGVTPDELQDAQRYLIGSIPRTLETNAGIASFLQTIEQFQLGLDYDRRLPELLASVTREQAHAAAAHLMPDRAAIAIAGPYAETGD